MKTRSVVWKEVAAFFLTAYLRRGSLGDLQREAKQLEQRTDKELKGLLTREVHKGSNARRVLLDEERSWHWEDTEVALADLRLGPGVSDRDYSSIVKGELGDSHPTVRELAEWLDSQPISTLVQLDTSITSFIPVGTVPRFYQRIIVGEHAPGKKSVKNRILDGYHRAVVLYLLGRRSVDCYFASEDASRSR